MSQPIYPPGGPQSIGQVLDTGFRIFKVALVRCLLYGVAGMIAGQLPNIYSLFAGRTLGVASGLRDPAWSGLYLVSIVLSLLVYAALVVRQHGTVTGQRRGMRAELASVFRRLPSILGVGLIGLTVTLVITGLLLIGSGTIPFGSAVVRGAALLLGLALAIPAMYYLIPFSLTTAAVMLDGKRALESVRYTARLAKGSWWRISIIYTMAVIILVAFYVVVAIAVSVLAFSITAGEDVVAMSASAAVVYVALGALGLPYTTAMVLAVYGELKVRREALDLETRLAAVAPT